jgi:hypothetical protein
VSTPQNHGTLTGWIAAEADDVRASYPEAVARIEAEAVAAYLASPEAERTLAGVIGRMPADREWAAAILAAWREALK